MALRDEPDAFDRIIFISAFRGAADPGQREDLMLRSILTQSCCHAKYSSCNATQHNFTHRFQGRLFNRHSASPFSVTGMVQILQMVGVLESLSARDGS